MGLYDTFCSSEAEDAIAVQLKTGPCLMYVYHPGDTVDREFEDAIYYGYEGVVVIKDRKVVSVSATLLEDWPELPRLTKWGGPFDPESEDLSSHNPIGHAMDAMKPKS